MRQGSPVTEAEAYSGRRPARSLAVVACAVAALVGLAALTPGASAAPRELTLKVGPRALHAPELSPLEATVLAPPQPVATTDGQRHLVYEIQLTNVSHNATVRVDRIYTRDANTKAILANWSGPSAISSVMQQPGAPATPTDTIGLHEYADVFLDVPLPPGTGTPTKLVHGFDVTITPPPTGFVFDGKLRHVLPTPVLNQPAAQVGSPLIGYRYLDVNGCCGESPHTRALQGVGASLYLSQRFAIDWLKLDANGNFYHGDFKVAEDHLIFGQPIVAVADATVVDTLDGLPENTPGCTPGGNGQDCPFLYDIDPSNALGNHVILDLGGGEYAMYAHMMTGSVRVHEGQHVQAGQLLGQVGNTGNSDAPHLHFQVMDAPAALASNGLAYGFGRFGLTGIATNVQDMQTTFEPANVIPVPAPHQRRNLLPLEGDVVSFGR
jgi:peptidase M23-like protein